MKKQMEGDDRQRRRRAADARENGQRPSEAGVTTGASKQLRTRDGGDSHDERITTPGWGKQQPDRTAPDPRPHSLREEQPGRGGGAETMPPTSENQGAVPGDLSETDQRVFETLARLEDPSSAPTAETIADDAGLDMEESIRALQRLIDTHDVVHELPADDSGRHYRIKSR